MDYQAVSHKGKPTRVKLKGTTEMNTIEQITLVIQEENHTHISRKKRRLFLTSEEGIPINLITLIITVADSTIPIQDSSQMRGRTRLIWLMYDKSFYTLFHNLGKHAQVVLDVTNSLLQLKLRKAAFWNWFFVLLIVSLLTLIIFCSRAIHFITKCHNYNNIYWS